MFFKSKKSIYGAGLALILMFLLGSLKAETIEKGNIIGFIYTKDGTTPLEGAIIRVENISTRSTFESTISDKNGIFKIEGIEQGVYVLGVKTSEGEFNLEDVIGLKIRSNETAKMSLSVNPYDKEVASAVQEVYVDQEISGESLIGTVIDYNEATRTAVVSIIKGLLRINDRIHAKGQKTDFYQNVRAIRKEGALVQIVLAGQVATIEVKKKVEKNDLIYSAKKRGILPLFIAPIGGVTLLAASAAVLHGTINIDEEPDQISPFKKELP